MYFVLVRASASFLLSVTELRLGLLVLLHLLT